MIIKKQEENKLLDRTEVQAEIAFDGATPARAGLRKEMAKLVKADEKLVIITKVDAKFGEKTATVYANVYKKEKALEETTLAHLKKRNGGKAAEKKDGEQPAKAEDSSSE